MKTKLLLLCVFFTTICMSQTIPDKFIEGEFIGKYALLGTEFVELRKVGDEALFIYKDETYKQINEYDSFKVPYSDLDKIYAYLTDFSEVEKGDGIKYMIDAEKDEFIRFVYGKTMGQLHVKMYHHRVGIEGVIRYLTPKQVAKLFDRKYVKPAKKKKNKKK